MTARTASAFALISALFGCSIGKLERVEQPTGEYSAIGRVVAALPVTLEADESLAARITTGTISAGLVGGVASAITEPGFTRPTAWVYHIERAGGEYITLVSHSVIDSGTCVAVKQYNSSQLPILRAEPAERCETSS